MKLPIPSFGKKQKQKYILALLLRDEKISALITEEAEGKMKIVGQHEEILTTPLEKIPYDEWLEILDRTISKAEETLPPDRETHDTVFGVKESWVEDKKIKKEYLLQLKKASEALALTPIGFLVINEAISHLIQAEEGAPVSAILVDIGKLSVTATLVRGSKIIESKSVIREDSLPRTVDNALKHFSSVDVFPSRVILFLGSSLSGDMENIEHMAQKFISHHWSKSLPFLHAPQISILGGGFDAKAVVQGAATQMGFEVLHLTEHKDEEIKNFDIAEKHSSHKKHEEPTKKDETITDDFEKAFASDEPPKKDDTEEKETEEKTSPEPDDAFGFLLDEDVTDRPKIKNDNFEPVHTHHKKEHEEEPELPKISYKQNQIGFQEDEEEKPTKKTTPLQKILATFTGIIPSADLSKIPLNKLPALPVLSGTKGRKILFAPLGILIVLGGLYFLYISSLSATVTLYLKPNNVSETTDILFSTESGNDFSENIIAAETVDTEIEGTVSTETTGKKAVGEKAKGTVTLYNNDTSRKTIPEGTTITNDKGLKFTTDKEVAIASASGDIFSGTKPGTATVAVTASEVGTDYNLPSGTKFNVSGISNVAGKNDSAFSGGTKRDVTVVAKKDQDKLLVELSKSLEEKALSELNGKTSGDKKLLEFLTQAAVTKRTFDRKVDDEAKKLTLKGTVSYEALSYNDKDLTDFATVILKNKYDDNLNLSEKGVSFSIDNEKQEDDGEVSATLNIEAGLVPAIDDKTVIEQIRGKSVKETEETLMKLPQVAEVKVALSPSVPFIPVWLPGNADKITIKTALHE